MISLSKAMKQSYVDEQRPSSTTSLDHSQIAYAAKEAPRTIAAPPRGNLQKAKRIIRYLRSHPTSVSRFVLQDPQSNPTGYTDSDWAGCRRTRRSTSGGAILNGTHLLLHWSRTQAGVALSSAEAELNATLKGGCEALGIGKSCREMGDELDIVLRGDAAAAQGILSRKGSGKVKHFEVRQLWFQEKVRRGDVTLEKVPRARNPSDAFTHHWTAAEGHQHCSHLHLLSGEGCDQKIW